MTYAFDDFELDGERFELRKAGKLVPVEPKVFLVLKHLIDNRDRMVSRDALIQHVWQGRNVSEWAISGAIKAARIALGDTAKDRRYIRTVHGQGFRFIASVDVPQQAQAAPADPSNGHPDDIPSIAVLPFAILGEDGDQDYFADGIVEDLITDLSKTPGLTVVSRNASLAFKHRPAGLELIREKLGVTHIVEGSLRRRAGSLRINANLVEVESGRQIWAERFDGTHDDVFALQDEINARIIGSLKLHFSQARVGHRSTSDPHAYDLCLKGRSEYYRYTPENFARALRFFEQATERDPSYAEAYSYQSYCRTAAYVFAMPGSDDTLAPAVSLAERAIALDKTSAIAHGRLGWVLGYLDRCDDAVTSFERAVALDPKSAEVYFAYGETMNRHAQPQRALALLEKAFSIDTFVPPSWEFGRAHSFVLLRRYDDAIASILQVLERVPGFIPARVQLTRAYAEAGRIDDARNEIHEIAKRAPRYRLANATRMFPYPDPAELEQFVSALRRAGLPE